MWKHVLADDVIGDFFRQAESLGAKLSSVTPIRLSFDWISTDELETISVAHVYPTIVPDANSDSELDVAASLRTKRRPEGKAASPSDLGPGLCPELFFCEGEGDDANVEVQLGTFPWMIGTFKYSVVLSRFWRSPQVVRWVVQFVVSGCIVCVGSPSDFKPEDFKPTHLEKDATPKGPEDGKEPEGGEPEFAIASPTSPASSSSSSSSPSLSSDEELGESPAAPADVP